MTGNNYPRNEPSRDQLPLQENSSSTEDTTTSTIPTTPTGQATHSCPLLSPVTPVVQSSEFALRSSGAGSSDMARSTEPVTHSSKASTVSTPTSSDFTMERMSSVIEESRGYLNNLVENLENGKYNVDMFVVFLQHISCGDEKLLCENFTEKAKSCAVSDLIGETVERIEVKRDGLCVDDEESRKEFDKLDNIISELIVWQHTVV